VSLLHKHAFFAFTHKRGGWDCMRHYEILAAGSVPYFADLKKCGKFCLALLPKALLRETLDMPGVSYIGHLDSGAAVNREFIEPIARNTAHMNYNRPGAIKHADFNETKYYEMADKLLQYTRENLSTKSIAAYIMHKVGVEDPKHVFVLGRDHMDYLELTVESGFADLGVNYTTNHVRPTWHQVPDREGGYTAKELEKLRDQRGLKSEMHGASMVLGLRTPPLLRDTNHDRIRQMLKNKEFDLVVYTWPHWPVQQYPFWNEVEASVPKERRVFLDGGDDGNDPHNDFRGAIKHGHIFRRELHEGQC
jgi:hypothetical protein